MESTRITVLGAGAWGLALADVLAGNGHTVSVWDRNDTAVADLNEKGMRSTLPGHRLHNSLTYTSDLASALADSEVVVGAVPSFAARGLLPAVIRADTKIYVNSSKGIEAETLMLPNQVFADVAQGSPTRYAVLAGPSHAEEVSRGIPTAVVAASTQPEVAKRVQELFTRPTFRVYTSSDCTGVELGGALKNVIAIAAGSCDSLGYGDNTKAALLARGLAEIARAAEALNANPATVMGLSGVGDLIVTAMSGHSRNRKFGQLIANGLSPESALEAVGAVVEGYRTAHSAYHLAQNHGYECVHIKLTRFEACPTGFN